MSRLAIDIDLGRIHAWSSPNGKVCYNSPVPPFEEFVHHNQILVEIASPSFYMPRYNKAEVTNRMKWAIFNAAVVGQIYQACKTMGVDNRLFVSPSSEWTLGYPEDIRVIMAGVAGKDNHDLRECQCMLYFHKCNPERWKPLPEYLESFSKAKGAQKCK